MATNLITVAMAMIPTGVAVMVWGVSSNDDRILFASWGIIIAGIVAWFYAFGLAKKEYADNKQERDYFIKLVEAIATKIGADISKIHGKK